MEYLKIKRDQVISLESKPNATAEQAITAAMEFNSKHKCDHCYIDYNGFKFGIDNDSNPKQLLEDYNDWLLSMWSYTDSKNKQNK